MIFLDMIKLAKKSSHLSVPLCPPVTFSLFFVTSYVVLYLLVVGSWMKKLKYCTPIPKCCLYWSFLFGVV